MVHELHENCGVIGVFNLSSEPASPKIYWGLKALNHRGHQSYGLLTYINHEKEFKIFKDRGLVKDLKNPEEWVEKLPGNVGIGNVRYSTSGRKDEESLLRGTQPFIFSDNGIEFGLAFNGNVVNTKELTEEIRKRHPNFNCWCDLQYIGEKLLFELVDGNDLIESVRNCMESVEGAFSVVGIKNGELFAFKDPHGIRPLCYGKEVEKDEVTSHVFASESVALNINGIEREYEVKPGEFILVTKDGKIERIQLVKPKRRAFCAFEFAYFARPDSKFNDRFVYEVREEFGRNLAREYSEVIRDADIIISMPETGNDAAYGLHEESGLRWERASRRHRYVTQRAFILLPSERYKTIDKKINVLAEKIKGKNVILVDDSIVRGDTTRVVVNKFRKMGAKKVYVMVTFPRITGPCFYGIDMATYSELIGAKYESEDIARIVGADAVCYQSIENFVKATGLRKDELCLGCVTGEYPTPLAQELADEWREKFKKGFEEKGRIYE